MKSFEELCLEYKPQDIADCFVVILQRGVGSSAEPCHSPMAFLAKAIDHVFAEVSERRKKVHDRADREQREAAVKRAEAEAQARESAEWEIKEKAFFAAFPSEDQQKQVLAEMCPNLPFKFSGEAIRIMGIGRWYESQ